MPRTEPNISKEALWERLEYSPHSEAQRRAHLATERFRVACCGRRWGKSFWEGHELTAKMFVPQSVNWIVGPKYSLGEKEFRVVWSDFKKLGLLNRCDKQYNINQGHMRIFFRDLESLLEVKSAEKPDSLVGEGVHHVCMSEAAKHKRSTWDMYVRPALADVNGSADFPSTPQGFNWFKGMFDIGQDEEFTDYVSWQFPSWTNPILFPGGRQDPEILEMEQSMSGMKFAQEVAAEFTSFEGMIYTDFSPDSHVMSFEYNPHWKNWWAFDFGFVDPFVCLDIMIDPSDRVWVWREYVTSYKSTQEHGHILMNQENPVGFHVDAMAADPRGADEIATLSQMLGSIQAHSVGWPLGVEAIMAAMKLREDGLPGLIIHPRCQTLIRQLRALRARETKEGHNAKLGQHDYDDHCPDALRYFFNEYFVLGGNASLKDLYDGHSTSEAAGFFTYETGVTLSQQFG